MSEVKSLKPHIKLDVPFGKDRVLLHTCCAPCSGAIIECLLDNGIRPTIFYCNPNIWPEEEYLIRKNECTRFAELMGLDIIDDDYDHEAWLRGLEELYRTESPKCSFNILAAAPERGERCLLCFKYRLLRTAQYAVKHGFRVMTTTLASSRWKSLPQINEAGKWAVSEVLAKSVDADVDDAVNCVKYNVGNAVVDGVKHIAENVENGVVDGAAESLKRGCSVDKGQDCGVNLVWWEQNWRKGGLQERRGQIIKEYDFYNQRWCGCEFSKTLISD